MDSFTEIVEDWGREALASDMDIPKERARQWSRDDSIPSWYWQKLLARARRRGIKITPNLLIRLAARDDK